MNEDAPLPQHLRPPAHLKDFLDRVLANPDAPLPRVICFDLDYTIWSLYLCSTGGPAFQPMPPIDGLHAVRCQRGRRIAVRPDVPGILLFLARLQARRKDLKLAIASRSRQPQWCKIVLGKLPLFPSNLVDGKASGDTTFFHLVPEPLRQIIPEISKSVHLHNIQKAAGGSFREFLFFDDESRFIKVAENLGVTGVHVDKRTSKSNDRGDIGLTWEFFAQGLQSFAAKQSIRTFFAPKPLPALPNAVTLPAKRKLEQVIDLTEDDD